MNVNVEYYNRFPSMLKHALIKEKVKFPECIMCKYKEFEVYRGVRYTTQKRAIDKTDFLSQMELKESRPMVVADENFIGSYSCSCFKNMEQMQNITKFPRKNKAIAKGKIRQEFGPIDINEDTTHIDLYLYDNVDPSSEFEVVKVWEKNG